jgi:hypothetical protein
MQDPFIQELQIKLRTIFISVSYSGRQSDLPNVLLIAPCACANSYQSVSSGRILSIWQSMHRYVLLYNQQLPQSVLQSRTPLQAMKDWHKLKPELFKKNPYYLTGCDT